MMIFIIYYLLSIIYYLLFNHLLFIYLQRSSTSPLAKDYLVEEGFPFTHQIGLIQISEVKIYMNQSIKGAISQVKTAYNAGKGKRTLNTKKKR